MILAGLKTGEIDIGIGRMSDPELMTGLNYELLFLESLKLVVRPNHPLLQENVTLSRVLEWPVVVSPEGTAPRQHSDALVQSGDVNSFGLYRNAVCFAISSTYG